MPVETDPSSADDERAAYAGRWVALAGRQVIGQGGTPEQARRASQAARHKESLKVEYVPTSQPFLFSPVLEQVRKIAPPAQPVYLVGGAVRDVLLGLPIHDLDFALAGDVLGLARRTANLLGGAYFPLDEERQTGRVILTGAAGRRQVLDFAALRGPDLEADLRGRDFTINAMAVALDAPQSLLDPTGGAADLSAKRLRACSPTSLGDDPLRILRGVRLAAAYQLNIELSTRQLMRQAAGELARVSPERIRDELFRILDGRRPDLAIRALDILGALPEILPETAGLKGVLQSPPHIHDVWEHTLDILHTLDQVLDVLQIEHDPEKVVSWALGLISVRLGRYRTQLHAHFASTSLNMDRSLRPLLFMAALYHDIAKPLTRTVDESSRVRFFEHDALGSELAGQRAQALHLSNPEIERLRTIVRHHMRPHLLGQTGGQISRRAIYRFFQATGPAGVDICLLSLADTLATYGPGLPQEVWIRQIDVIRTLLEACWEQPEESVSPPPLISGKDLLDQFHLTPGPQIGSLLEQLREAQAMGEIQDRPAALEYIRKILDVDAHHPAN